MPPIPQVKYYTIVAINPTALLVNTYDLPEAQAYYDEVVNRDPLASMLLCEWSGSNVTLVASKIVPPPKPGE